jgi:hypothetical protein
MVEDSVRSFAIKLWVEQPTFEGERAALRGYITDVQGGERRYLKDLKEIIPFIKSYY